MGDMPSVNQIPAALLTTILVQPQASDILYPVYPQLMCHVLMVPHLQQQSYVIATQFHWIQPIQPLPQTAPPVNFPTVPPAAVSYPRLQSHVIVPQLNCNQLLSQPSAPPTRLPSSLPTSAFRTAQDQAFGPPHRLMETLESSMLGVADLPWNWYNVQNTPLSAQDIDGFLQQHQYQNYQ